MRKLATALDANPMSLYHHVPNKEAVLRGVARTIGAQFRTVTLQEAPWQERIRLLATDFRSLAHRHPELMAYSFSHQPDFIQPDDPFWSELTAIVAAAGVPQPKVSEAAAVMVAVVIGVLSAELNGSLEQWSNLKPPVSVSDGAAAVEAGTGAVIQGAGPDPDHMFRLVIDTLVTGLEARLADGHHGEPNGR
ncbi:TetR/AcrR family transcriptional regulator [Streptomyces sp. NPDC085900]|uniref:TetR/AcrR family transcriptional regulator n=1 Tax=Streptomyces sp. NPDC085900 TaxID=3365737 RepID=UPI0037D5E963